MNFRLHLLLLPLLCLLIFSCKKNQKEETTPSNDINNNSKFPAINKELIFEIKGDTIAGYALIANGESLKETVILVAGYPGNDNNFDIAQAIRRSGKNVIHFNHRGAWGSQGKYMYSNCLEDIDQVINYLSQPDVAKNLRIDTNQFTLLGRSYGGGVALIQGSQNDQVKKIIAITSVNYGSIMQRHKSLDDLGGFKKYMKKQVMIATNINRFLQEMLDHKVAFNILTYKDAIKNKKVLIIEDSDKNDKWINQLENVEILKMETDHNFINKRIELTDHIIQFLSRV